MTEPPPDAPDLGALGGAMRAEWHDEADAAARDAYEQWQHRRTLAELLADSMVRGDVVVATIGTTTLRGRVVDVGRDRVAIETGAGRVDVHLGSRLVVGVEPGSGDGQAGAPGITWRARFLELEAQGTPVAAEAAGVALRGTVTVGADHVVVRAGDVTRVVALDALDWVRVDTDPR